MEAEKKEAIVFSDEELFAALDKHIGHKQSLDFKLEDNVDPGTITKPEMQERYGFGRAAATKYINMLVSRGVLERSWVVRSDNWPPYGTRLRQGYRYTGKILEEE